MSLLERFNIKEQPEIPYQYGINWDGYKPFPDIDTLLSLTIKPKVNWFDNENKNKQFSDILIEASWLVSFWYHNNNVPRWIEKFQSDAVIRMVALALQGKNLQLLSGTGTGKTYMLLSVLDILCYYGYIEQLQTLENKTYPFPIVFFTPPSVIEQTNVVKKLYPNVNPRCIVINYETLRTKQGLGNVFIEWKVQSIDGEIEEEPFWRTDLSPCILVCDENQKLKNNGSLQTRFIQKYNDLKNARKVMTLFSSATPFTRPIESKTVALSLSPLLELTNEYLTKVRKIFVPNNDLTTNTRMVHDLKEVKIDYIPRVKHNNFDYWLNNEILLGRNLATDYSPAAMERITDYLSAEYQLVRVEDVKFKHKTINKHLLINFASANERKVYDAAYEEYINKLLTTNRNEPGGMAAIFVAMLKFRMAAELLRAPHLAKLIDSRVKQSKNVIAATAFKETQEAILHRLIEDYGYTKEQISMIRGGQTKKSRWDNINKFQDEKTNIILVMIQAGGVGLSLHHHKPRNKRPRHVIMPPVWSIIEMLQMLGRAHRINSESTTHQEIVWYAGTIEGSVCEKLKKKAVSMRELMRRKEQWSDLFVEESLRHKVGSDLDSLLEKERSESLNVEHANDNEDSEDTVDMFNTDEEMIANNLVESE